MKRKKAKPTYGNSQGSKSSELSGDRGHKKSSVSSDPQYAKSGEFIDRQKQKDRSLRSSSVTLHSLPRKIFKVGIVGLILYPLLVYTPIGKSIITRASLAVSGVRQKVAATQSEVNLKNMGDKRQKASDDRFNDALKKSGIEPDKK
jgi:hypothetical protein